MLACRKWRAGNQKIGGSGALLTEVSLPAA
jgi:hypothetical protein